MSTGHHYRVIHSSSESDESDSESDNHCTCGADSSCEEDEPSEIDTDDDVLSKTDAIIQKFVNTHAGHKKIYIAVTADKCPPCQRLKAPNNLNWHTAKEAGTTTFKSHDAVALCFTVLFRQETFESSFFGIKGYPTILEYSMGSKHWKKSDTSDLESKTWVPLVSQ